MASSLSEDLSRLARLESLILRTHDLADYAEKQFPNAPLPIGRYSNHVEDNVRFVKDRDALFDDIEQLLIAKWDMLTYRRFQAARERFVRSISAGSNPVMGRAIRCRCWWDARDQLLAVSDFLFALRAERSGSEIHHDWIFSNTFVVESGLSQGTCFQAEGVGLVTCAHVIPENETDLSVFRASSPGNRFSATSRFKERAIDLALIEAPDLQREKGLPCGSASSMVAGEKIYLIGFPNYRVGDSGIISEGMVTGFRTVSTIKRLLINAHIVSGNSGGPVLNALGQVIGVAVTGADRMEDVDKTEHHSVVPIDALQSLMGLGK